MAAAKSKTSKSTIIVCHRLSLLHYRNSSIFVVPLIIANKLHSVKSWCFRKATSPTVTTAVPDVFRSRAILLLLLIIIIKLGSTTCAEYNISYIMVQHPHARTHTQLDHPPATHAPHRHRRCRCPVAVAVTAARAARGATAKTYWRKYTS